MGQRVNPNIFRLGKTQNWKSKYLENKTSETYAYAYKDFEMKNFINKFFKDNGLIVQNCKVNFSSEGPLHIFVSYYLTLKSIVLINNINNGQRIGLSKQRKNGKLKTKQIKIKKNIKNYVKYNNVKLNQNLRALLPKKFKREVRNIIFDEKTSYKIRRINLLKYYKSFISVSKLSQFNLIQMNSFSEKLIKSLRIFINKKTRVILTLKQLNTNLKQNLTKEKIKFIKKNLAKLKKYAQNDFFKEGVNLAFISMTQPQAASLLTDFIATQLSKLKKHNFFIKFLKTTLIVFKNSKFSKAQGIRIKIKGRFNGRPRAKQRIISIGNGTPVLTLNSNIDYSESTSYTANGTFGVKIWMYYRI
jgi:ribosomal protein S3